MSRETRPIPGLFGGVSQQIPAMRHPTQGEHQHNMLATTVDGLFLRPGSQAAATPLSAIGDTADRAHAHWFSTPDGTLYCLTLAHRVIQLHTAAGVPQTITTPDGLLYLSTAEPETAFACLTLADYTFIVNRGATPAMLGTVVPANPTDVAYVEVRTAVANQNYTVAVDGIPETYAAGATPSQADIAANLASQLSTTLGVGYAVAVIGYTNIIKVVKTAGTPVVVASDSWDNRTMMVVSNGVPTYPDLPSRFETGYTVTIHGTADETSDPYYVKWDGSKWVETAKPGALTTFNKATMPHQLVKTGASTWTFQAVPDWGVRLVGDDDTNPEPSFIGTPIRSLFFYRNRLGFLALDNCILSRAGEYFEFFARSATQVLDSDPIDLAPPIGGIGYFSHAQELNENLIIWTDTNKQLSLRGADVMSPKNARLLPTTTFAMDPATPPATLGSRSIFAENSGSYAHLSVYKASAETATNLASQVTDHVPRLLKASPRALVASTSTKMVAVLPASGADNLHLFRYDLDDRGEEYRQKAWCSLSLAGSGTHRVIAGHWDKHRLYLLVHRYGPSDPTAYGRFFIEAIDFRSDSADGSLDYALCLDRRQTLSLSYSAGPNTTSASFPYVDAGTVFYRCEPGKAPLQVYPVSTNTAGGLSTTVTFAGNLTAYSVLAGVPYDGDYTFTEVVFRDQDGIPVQAATVKLLAYYVRLASSSDVVFSITPYLRGTSTYKASAYDLQDAPTALGGLLLATGDVKVPVQAKATGTRVSLKVSGPLRASIPYAEWLGEVTMNARR